MFLSLPQFTWQVQKSQHQAGEAASWVTFVTFEAILNPVIPPRSRWWLREPGIMFHRVKFYIRFHTDIKILLFHKKFNTKSLKLLTPLHVAMRPFLLHAGHRVGHFLLP